MLRACGVVLFPSGDVRRHSSKLLMVRSVRLTDLRPLAMRLGPDGPAVLEVRSGLNLVPDRQGTSCRYGLSEPHDVADGPVAGTGRSFDVVFDSVEVGRGLEPGAEGDDVGDASADHADADDVVQCAELEVRTWTGDLPANAVEALQPQADDRPCGRTASVQDTQGRGETLHPERPIALDPGEEFRSMGLRAEGSAKAIHIAQRGERSLVACGAAGSRL